MMPIHPIVKYAGVFLAGAGVGAIPTYIITERYTALNVFTKVGLPSDRITLQAELIKRNPLYATDWWTLLATASIWELQCLLGAHMVGEKYHLPAV